jgi:5-methylcytosine-specific restriction endonuclease McrBC regulatory subunit McrC
MPTFAIMVMSRYRANDALILNQKCNSDAKQGVSQADVYHLMAYGRLYDCPKVMLLYPHNEDLPPEPIQ